MAVGRVFFYITLVFLFLMVVWLLYEILFEKDKEMKKTSITEILIEIALLLFMALLIFSQSLPVR
jgi:hypothetical protein